MSQSAPDSEGWWWFRDARTRVVSCLRVEYGLQGTDLVAWRGKRAQAVKYMVGEWVRAVPPWDKKESA